MLPERKSMIEKIVAAIESAERKLNKQIPETVWFDVLMYSMRKCMVVGKEEAYLPILFENELLDHYMRQEFTGKGGCSYVQHAVPTLA